MTIDIMNWTDVPENDVPINVIEDDNKWKKIFELKQTGIYALILSYPFPGISRAEKHNLCEWLMKQLGDLK